MTDAVDARSDAVVNDAFRHSARTVDALRIQVRSEDGTVLWFRLRKNQKMKRLFDYYKQNVHSHKDETNPTATTPKQNETILEFRYKGRLLHSTHTPQTLHMNEGDVIECVTCNSNRPSTEYALTVSVRDQNGIEIWFRIRKQQKLRTMFRHYASMVRYPAGAFQFSWNGRPLHDTQTASNVGLKDGDVIDSWSPFPAAAA